VAWAILMPVPDESGDDQRGQRVEDWQPDRAPTSAASTVTDVHTSPRASRGVGEYFAAQRRSASRDSY
jgi:hypothetical protein